MLVLVFANVPTCMLFFPLKLAKTVQGHDGQLFDSTWRHKGKRYLCFTREVHYVNFMFLHELEFYC